MPPKSNNWCYTFFPDIIQYRTEEQQIQRIHVHWEFFVERAFNVSVGQIERCPESGRLHLQAYGETHAVTRDCLSRKLPRASLRRRHGSRFQAITYCIKNNTRIMGDVFWYPNKESFGDLNGNQGKRTDIVEFLDVMGEQGIDAAMEEHPEAFVRYHKGFERLNDRRLYLAAQRDCPRDVFVLWGDPGTGKTRAVFEHAKLKYGRDGYEDVFRVPLGSTEWWNNYLNQPIILLDDFFGQLPLSRLLNLLDRYPVQLPTKGGFRSGTYSEVWITSNVPWEQWYVTAFEKHPLLMQALKRRFKNVTRYLNPL